MFCAMIVSACPARVAGSSVASAMPMALRTSGGRSVEVRAMSCTMLSRKDGSIAASIIEGLMATRVERDPLGEVQVPAAAYYGAQTQRAVENFPISGLKAPAALVSATVLVKQACARANGALGRLDPAVADAIARAADEILGGQLRDQFVVDVYQAGAGTSHNMNTNEVLANRAG